MEGRGRRAHARQPGRRGRRPHVAAVRHVDDRSDPARCGRSAAWHEEDGVLRRRDPLPCARPRRGCCARRDRRTHRHHRGAPRRRSAGRQQGQKLARRFARWMEFDPHGSRVGSRATSPVPRAGRIALDSGRAAELGVRCRSLDEVLGRWRAHGGRGHPLTELSPGSQWSLAHAGCTLACMSLQIEPARCPPHTAPRPRRDRAAPPPAHGPRPVRLHQPPRHHDSRTARCCGRSGRTSPSRHLGGPRWRGRVLRRRSRDGAHSPSSPGWPPPPRGSWAWCSWHGRWRSSGEWASIGCSCGTASSAKWPPRRRSHGGRRPRLVRRRPLVGRRPRSQRPPALLRRRGGRCSTHRGRDRVVAPGRSGRGLRTRPGGSSTSPPTWRSASRSGTPSSPARTFRERHVHTHRVDRAPRPRWRSLIVGRWGRTLLAVATPLRVAWIERASDDVSVVHLAGRNADLRRGAAGQFCILRPLTPRGMVARQPVLAVADERRAAVQHQAPWRRLRSPVRGCPSAPASPWKGRSG